MLELTEFYRYFHLGLIPANYKNNKNLVSLPYLTSNHWSSSFIDPARVGQRYGNSNIRKISNDGINWRKIYIIVAVVLWSILLHIIKQCKVHVLLSLFCIQRKPFSNIIVISIKSFHFLWSLKKLTFGLEKSYRVI